MGADPTPPHSETPPPASSTPPSLGPHWVAKARKDAHTHMRRLDRGRTRRQLAAIAEIDDPVERARRIAELSAPADMELLQAIRFGLDLETAERFRHPLRLVADIASRSLSIVGLRAGDVQTFDVSDRFREFLARWDADSPTAPHVIDVTPAPPPALER